MGEARTKGALAGAWKCRQDEAPTLAFHSGGVEHQVLVCLDGDAPVEPPLEEGEGVIERVHAAGAEVAEVDIGRIKHDSRDLGHYNAMAEVIMSFFLDQQTRRITEELVVMAEDAGQVIDAVLGALARRSKSGGPVTVFLGQNQGAEAEILRDALSPFPTARVKSLEQALEFEPASPAGHAARLFAPYPAANEDRAVRIALQVQSQLVVRPDLLLMPLGAGRSAVGGFCPDVALDVGEGGAIKRDAVARMTAQTARVAEPAGPLEMFQSFDSLPDPLRIRLRPEPSTDAGNM